MHGASFRDFVVPLGSLDLSVLSLRIIPIHKTLLLGCLLLGFFVASIQAEPCGPPAGQGSYEDLVNLQAEFVEWRAGGAEQSGNIRQDDAGRPVEAVADFSVEAVTRRLTTLQTFQARMQVMNVAAWPRVQQVDWPAVRSRLDQQEYRLRLSRPWARDPGFLHRSPDVACVYGAAGGECR